MQKPGQIIRVVPAAAIPNGEVACEYGRVPAPEVSHLSFDFGGDRSHITAVANTRALVRVPPAGGPGPLAVNVRSDSFADMQSAVSVHVGKLLAADLHPVANPAFHPADGGLFVTRSGSRGEHVPVSIFRIDPNGTREEFSGDIMNPTAISFDRTGRMFVTSRFDGNVYRISPLGEVTAFATDLGIATGLAFNREGDMFVGDRSGTIFRINEIGAAQKWAEHEPSVSAYHLAFGPDDALYVTGPTVSSFDAITRFDPEGRASTFFRGLGRPQGLAFDRDGNLYVAASLKGARGVVRISEDGNAELAVAGMNVVGLAFSSSGEMVVATNDSVFSLSLGIYGALLP